MLLFLLIHLTSCHTLCPSLGFTLSLLFCGASRWLVYSSRQSSQPVWQSHLPLSVPWLWALLHPEEPPLGPLHQSVRPSDQLSQWVSSSTFLPSYIQHTSKNYTSSSPAINKKLKQTWLCRGCFAFLWLLLCAEPQSCKCLGFGWGMYGGNIPTSNCHN